MEWSLLKFQPLVFVWNWPNDTLHQSPSANAEWCRMLLNTQHQWLQYKWYIPKYSMNVPCPRNFFFLKVLYRCVWKMEMVINKILSLHLFYDFESTTYILGNFGDSWFLWQKKRKKKSSICTNTVSIVKFISAVELDFFLFSATIHTTESAAAALIPLLAFHCCVLTNAFSSQCIHF